MRFLPRNAIRVFACLLTFSLYAVEGHWSGTMQTPQGAMQIEFDLTRDSGTFSIPSRALNGLPLDAVRIEGPTITLDIALRAGGGTFRGTIDGNSISGMYTHAADSMEVPLDLKRTGDAKIEWATKSNVSSDLEGAWRGTLDVNGTKKDIALDLTRGVISADGLAIPITTIEQNGTNVTLDVKRIGGSWDGALRDGTLAGMWTQGPFRGELNFHRAANAVVDRWAVALGGREKLAAIKATYREAVLYWGDQEGSIKVWHTADGKYRKEEQIATMSVVEIFDGTNGSIQRGGGPMQPMTGAELARAKSTAYANWNAAFFVFFPERRSGDLVIDNDNTILLEPRGGLARRITLDPKTSLPKVTTHQQGDQTITVTFASYETIDGVVFEKEIHRMMSDPHFNSVIRFTKTVINPEVDAGLFVVER